MPANLPVFILMVIASLWDIKHREVPDWIPIAIALTSLPAFQPYRLLGILSAVPFLAAALWKAEGMGGGDIKFMAAAGLAFGFVQGLCAAVLGLTLVLSVHLVQKNWNKRTGEGSQRAYPLIPFLTCGYAATIWMGGSI